jgi:bifunctional non-homologous end joining protein LigD
LREHVADSLSATPLRGRLHHGIITKRGVLGMAREQRLPKRLQPMLATLTDAPFDDPDWLFETKWDGFRMIACSVRGKVTLYSRNGKIISSRYRNVAEALEKVKADTVLDGELVALDQRGVSHFQLLQNALRAEAPLRYCIFDVMFAGGEDLRILPLIERKKRLRRLLPKNRLLAFSEDRMEYGTKYFKEAEKAGLEGIMAKRASSPYLSGLRTTDWLKIKTSRRQEVVIVGFTAPRRSRPYFGALVLAVRDGDHWRYVGHVGAGFTHAALKALHGKLSGLVTGKSPFNKRVKDETVTTWVKPKLVAEIKFTEWTEAGEMRHPVFLGLRDDKRAQDVVRENEKRSPIR